MKQGDVVIDAQAIAAVDMFADLELEQLERLAAIASEVKRDKGNILFQTGDPADGLYALASGRMKIFRSSPGGKEKILHVIGPGTVFAEAAVFSGKVFPADAQAMEDSVLLFFPRERMRDLMGQDPELAMAMMGLLSRRLRGLVAQIDQLSLKEVPARLASHLLVLAASHSAQDFPLDLPKGQLAAYLGTIPETLSRVLRRMSDDGFIEVKGKQVTILDKAGLEDVAEGDI